LGPRAARNFGLDRRRQEGVMEPTRQEEARRYEEVKQKLDALVDAERKMLQRNKPARKP